MSNIDNFLNKVKQNLELITFQETIEVIDSNYSFTPTTFKNGNQLNNTGENNGSCKIFAFSKIHHLEKEETLSLFGSYYFDDMVDTWSEGKLNELVFLKAKNEKSDRIISTWKFTHH